MSDIVSDDIVEKAEAGAEALHEVADVFEELGADGLDVSVAVKLRENYPDAYEALTTFDDAFSRLADDDDGTDSFRVDDTLR